MKDKITVKALLITKDLKDIEPTEVAITVDGLNSAQDQTYSYRLPDYIYNALVGTQDKYKSYSDWQKEKQDNKRDPNYKDTGYLDRTIKSTMISIIITTLETYSFEINNILRRDELKKVKKIFVAFSSSVHRERCNWTGGYMGKRNGSSFQFFIGYEVMECVNLFDSKPTAQYYTLIKYATGTFAHNDTGFMESHRLEPLHFKGRAQEFLRQFQMVDWTQEREDYLTRIQDELIAVNERLSSFLSDMTDEKLNLLIENSKNNQQNLLGISHEQGQ